jgi:hypothetical protein
MFGAIAEQNKFLLFDKRRGDGNVVAKIMGDFYDL